MASDNPNNTRPPEAVEEPSELDILMGRSEYCYNHVGNQAFRTIIDVNLGWYSSVMKARKVNKMAVVSSIMNTITHGGGWFLRQNPNDLLWYKVSYKDAREKVTHALRNRLKQLTKRAPLVLQADKHSDDDWSSLVWKAAKLKEDRYRKELSQSEGVFFNQGHSTDKQSITHNKFDRLEAEYLKWFPPFVRDTLQESLMSAGRPDDTADPRSYMGSRPGAAPPSSAMHGTHTNSWEPLPIQLVHSERNKSHHKHCPDSMGPNVGGTTKEPCAVAAKTPCATTLAPSDDTISPAPIMSATPNFVTPPQGPQPAPPHQLLAKLMSVAEETANNVAETSAGKISKSNDNSAINHKSFCCTTKSSVNPVDFGTSQRGSCPPSGELLAQRMPHNFLLPRQVSLEQESTDSVTETSALAASKTANDNTKSSANLDAFATSEQGLCPPSGELLAQRMSDNFLLPQQVSLEQASAAGKVTETSTKPCDIIAFASIAGDVNLGIEEAASWNHSASAFLDSSSGANSERFCQATLEASENDDEASVDLEKLMTGLQGIENANGTCEHHSSSSFMVPSCENSECSCCFETREGHDDGSVDYESLMMDLDDTEHLNSCSKLAF